jgi:hypothetical protein
VARSYDPRPSYAASGGRIERGLPPLPDGVLAIDGPAALAWERLVAALPGRPIVDIRDSHLPWDEIERRTGGVATDPVFRRIWDGPLAELVGALPDPRPGTIVFGPGAALVRHDELWYADRPKRNALAAVRRGEAPNVGQAGGSRGTEQRLLFVDWPLLDGHKEELVDRIDRYVDCSDLDSPGWVAGDVLRRTLAGLARRPFRTLPAFLPGPWGGQWPRRELGIETGAPNLAWSYELISPEASVLIDGIEVGFELLMAAEGETLVGREVLARFGSSFPIRFDYLDTLEGATSRSSATRRRRTCSRRSACRTRRTRPTTSSRRPPAPSCSSGSGRTPRSRRSAATRARRWGAAHSSRSATCSFRTPSSISST